MARKVLVTGGAGFVGSHLIDALIQQEYEVTVFDCMPLDRARNLDQAKTSKGFKYVVGDIRDKIALENALDKDTSMIFHLASIVGIHKYIDDPFGLIDISIGGLRNVAELALRNGTKIVFTSTSEVFGKNPDIPWKEDSDRVLGSTSVDRWSYSSSKAVCEHMLFALYRQKQLPITIVRYFNAYGPRQNPIFVVSQSVKRVLNGERPYLYDDGKQTRCFTYVDDAINGTLLAANHPEGNGQAFNIGNDREVTIGEVVNLVIKHSGRNIEPQLFNTEEKYGSTYEDIPRRVPSNEKARTILGWSPNVDHEEGIRRTVEWAKQNEWWLK